jgi:hypothetical protein
MLPDPIADHSLRGPNEGGAHTLNTLAGSLTQMRFGFPRHPAPEHTRKEK